MSTLRPYELEERRRHQAAELAFMERMVMEKRKMEEERLKLKKLWDDHLVAEFKKKTNSLRK